MIRGKYLRERKGIRFKRRLKLIMAIFVLLLVHRIVFNSFSLYESNATTTANIEVAYFLLDDTYEEKTIMLEDMKPGDTKEVDIAISNYFLDEEGNEVITETDMQYTFKLRTTTNLPLEYSIFLNQSSDSGTNIVQMDTIQDDHDTYFYQLLEDTREFSYEDGQTNTYTLKITLPEQYNNVEYQNVIECIEVVVDGQQKTV
ncbi:MAG: hypothetical protein IKJ36_03345 [Clostridia bacterium]|nr:hypothetical protein [Clostridia bacterium]